MTLVVPTDLPEVLLITPKTFHDARGYFREIWNEDRYQAAGITGPFVQDNLSFSEPGVLRGLHLQNPNQQSKLVSVTRGEIFDVAVDVRTGSPNFGKWTGVRLSAENGEQLYIPPGFAHGFSVIDGPALVSYKVDAPYDPAAELTIHWADADIGIDWPDADWSGSGPVLSECDQVGIRLADMPDQLLPRYGKTG